MSTPDDIDDSSAPLIEHLAELRNRLIWAVSSFIVAMILCFIVAEPILDFLLQPIEQAMRGLGNPNPVMQYTAPQEYFFTLVRISMAGGLAISFPVIGYHLWRFIAPGLYKSEKSAFLPFLIASPVLFTLGAAFSHYVVTPLAMSFFLGFADAASLLSTLLPLINDAQLDGAMLPTDLPDTGIDIIFQGKVNETLDISLKLIIAFGLCFQLPVLLTLMGKAGLAQICGCDDLDGRSTCHSTRCDESDDPLLRSLPALRGFDLSHSADREKARGRAARPRLVGGPRGRRR